MRCINFDREFERYIAAWMKEHAKEYRTYDDMEAAMPDVYAQFLDTPVNWLQGMKPGEYFGQFDNARQLVNWMEDYFKQRIPVPDMQEEIAERLSLKAALDGLEERDKKIINLRYFQSKTQVETAKLLSLTQVQVSRREKKILGEIRRLMSG